MKTPLTQSGISGALFWSHATLLTIARNSWRIVRNWIVSHADLLAQQLLILIAGGMRFWRIETPDDLVFDEVYFPVFAKNYLDAVPFFDSHPPLGKYLIAIGIRFFGFVPLGYRVMSALFGIGVILLVYRLTRQLFAGREVAFLAALLSCADGMLLVESRAGLINIFAVFFCLAAYHFFLRCGEERLQKPRWLYLVSAGVCIGAAISVKWIGVACFGVILVSFLTAKTARQWPRLRMLVPRQPLLSRLAEIHPDAFLLSCVFIPGLVYVLSFSMHLQQNPSYPFFELQRQMFGYHAHLQDGHHYASPWWSWPLLQRPVNYYYEVDAAAQQVMTIVNLGNPALWWLAIPATLFGLWYGLRYRHAGIIFVLLAGAAHYLPFALISRASFLYHFMGALPFEIILLAFALHRLWHQGRLGRELAALAVAAIVACAFYFYPIWTAVPIPQGSFYQRMWFGSWI